MSDDPPVPDLGAAEGRLADLALAVGLCIIAWATVELELCMLFRWATGAASEVADALFVAPRSFEVRATMLHAVMRPRLKKTPHLSDWNLLYNYVLRMAGKRNEVAHATALNEREQGLVLEPYFVLSQPKEHITIDQVNARTADFHALEGCLMWLRHQLIPPHPLQPPEPPTSTPDLLLRLRTEDARKREEQRAQQKPAPR